MSINRMIERILAKDAKFPSIATENILKKLSFTKERQALLTNPEVQQVINHPEFEKGYVFGSTASNKANPRDLDFVGISNALHPNTSRAKAEARFDSIAEVLDKIETKGTKNTIDAHFLERTHPEDYGGFLDNTKDPEGYLRYIINEGRKRYGSDYKLKRIFSVAPSVMNPYFGMKRTGEES